MSIYTTKEPLLLRGVFKKFDDTRGFLSAIDLRDLELSVNCENFHYQLLTHTNDRYTFRGFHFQEKPFEQAKLVRVISGKVFDVAVDIRKDSPTFTQWVSITLSSENKKQLWIPEGFAHGFIALSSNTELVYKVTNYYNSSYDRTIKYDSPVFRIDWPVNKSEIILSNKDKDGSIDIEI